MSEQDRYILIIGRGLSNNRQGLNKGKKQLTNTKTILYGDNALKNIKPQIDEENEEYEISDEEKQYLYQKYGQNMPSKQHFDNLIDYMKKDKKLTKQEATEIMRDIIYAEKHPHINLPKRDRSKKNYQYPIKFKDDK